MLHFIIRKQVWVPELKQLLNASFWLCCAIHKSCGNALSWKLKHNVLAGYHPKLSESGDHLAAACLEEGWWILREAKVFEDCRNGLNSQAFFFFRCLLCFLLLASPLLLHCSVVGWWAFKPSAETNWSGLLSAGRQNWSPFRWCLWLSRRRLYPPPECPKSKQQRLITAFF